MSGMTGGVGRKARERQERAKKPSARLSRAAIAFPIDTVADAALAARASEAPIDKCHVCGRIVESDPHRGLFVWARGEERRIEEPALCEPCAVVLGISALAMWRRFEEEDE